MTIKTRSETREIGTLTRDGEVATVDEKARTVDVVFSTGAKVLRNSWFDGPSYEELSMDPKHVRMGRLQSGSAPFLANHDSYDVADQPGVVTSARIENGVGHATIRFAKAEDDANADKLFRKMKDGIVRNISIGYRTYKSENVTPPDAPRGATPTYRAVDWEPHEISLVTIPADAAAGTRSATQQKLNPCVFVTREQEQTVDEEQKKREAEAAKLAADKARADQLQRDADSKVKADADAARGAQAERERISGIMTACRTAKLDDAFSKKLIDDGATLDSARAQVLEALAKRSDDTAINSHHATIKVGEESREKWVRGAEAGQLNKSGAMIMLAGAMASTKTKGDTFGARMVAPGLATVFASIDQKDNGGEFRGMSIVDLARDYLESRGKRTRGMDADQTLKTALNHRDSGGDQTTSDFGVVLENLMYKTLLGFYAQADDTWRRWCGVDSVDDFRPANRYRLGSFGILDQMQEGDEYKHKKVPDGFKQQISVNSYGNKISLSRRALINDDMGAIMAQAESFGRSAGLSLEVLAYSATAGIAANSGLGPTVTAFGLTHALMNDAFGNINDTGAALSVTGLEADRVVMASQKDPNNNEILALRPDVLLLPIGLEGEAKVINRSTTDPTIVTGNPAQRPNIVAGLFRDIVGTARLTGTRRYLISQGQGVDAFKMVFLNGSQVPFMEQRPGWDTDGIEWKLRHDFNFVGFDPKGIVTNAGA